MLDKHRASQLVLAGYVGGGIGVCGQNAFIVEPDDMEMAATVLQLGENGLDCVYSVQQLKSR